MELQTFVSQTLVQIAHGITDAQKATADLGVLINPPLCTEHSSQGTCVNVNTGNGINFIPQEISFDVSVYVESTESAEGEGKIKVAILNLGGGINSESKQSLNSRIAFKIPVCWTPAYPAKEQKTEGFVFPHPRQSPFDQY